MRLLLGTKMFLFGQCMTVVGAKYYTAVVLASHYKLYLEPGSPYFSCQFLPHPMIQWPLRSCRRNIKIIGYRLPVQLPLPKIFEFTSNIKAYAF